MKTKFECEIGRTSSDYAEDDEFILGKKLEIEKGDDIVDWTPLMGFTSFFCARGFRKMVGSFLGLRPGTKGRFRITIERIDGKKIKAKKKR